MSMVHGERLTARIVRDEDRWDDMRPQWDDLYAGSPSASPFLQFVWLRTWWQHYGAAYGAEGLRVLGLWDGGDLVGALPLYLTGATGSVRARVLRFISTGEAEEEETCPDYLDLLCRPGFERACADAAWREIARLEWDRLELVDLPAASALLGSSAIPSRARSAARGTCPVADMTGGFEAYLGRLSSNSRQQARRLLREADQAGVRFALASGDEAAAAFGDLVRLHQERWAADQKAGAFATARFTGFHRRLVRDMVPGGHAVLARLSLDDAPVAVLYGFVTRQSFAFYQSGVRREAGPLRSPGNLAHLKLMQALADRGVTAYDFLRGAASYKERLATRENALAAVSVRRPTLRGATEWPLRLAGRLAGTHLRAGREERP